MRALRIVFMGTPEFAVPSLRAIHKSQHQIVGVVTQPDRPKGRGLKLAPPPVKQFALQHGIEPILQPEKLRDPNFIEQLKQLGADLFVVVAFRILPEEVFTIPPRGTINLHPSLLPKYRGAAPIHWAIINCEKITGVTTIFIRKEVDAGNIILQKEVPIFEDDTAGTLHDRLAEEGAELLLETIDRIAAGTVVTRPQDESQATPAPKITREMAHLNFAQSAERVKCWIHGLSPVPGAYAFYQDKMIKFYRARAIQPEGTSHQPGEIIRTNGSNLWIACQPGIIAIEEIQPEGKRIMSVAEFLRGYRLKPGERFH